MNGFLLDTNCISELIRIKPDQRVVEWIASVDEELLYFSVLTLGEIRKGVAALPRMKRRAELEAWLEVELKSRFDTRLLSVDEAVADRWGLLAAQAKQAGKPLAVIDGLLAATAQHFNLTLATRNVADFAVTSVPVLNPWEAR